VNQDTSGDPIPCHFSPGYRFTQMSKTSLDKSKIKFLLLEGVHPSAVEVLKAAGYTSIEYITSSLPEAQLKRKIADAHFVGIRSRTQLTEEVFAHATSWWRWAASASAPTRWT
jgi:D-3-phosphoglycerate dehydrogenase